jgi:DNA invertase Pin-like site-specific DNA recombinase
MAKAFSYIRFSTPEQARGDSLRRQLQAAQDWCAQRGLVLDDTLRDLGRSAYKGGHAQFGALRDFLALVEKGEIERGSFLIVESLDRLSREAVLVALPRLLDLIAAGITVVTLSDGQEYSDSRLLADPSPLIMSLLIMMRAHEESRTKGMRVGKAWAQKRVLAAETGQAMTAICPGWLRLVGGPKRGAYELIPERALIVQRIFRETIDGQGRRSIAKALNSEGVPTWGVGRKRGALWHDSYVQKILRNPATFGTYEPLSKLAGGDGSGNIRIDGYFPAAIEEDTFYLAQVAAGVRRQGEGRPAAGHRNLLRGLAKCGSCGSNLIVIDKGKRSSGPKLTCSRAWAAAGCDDRTYHAYAPLELGVLAAVSDQLDRLILSSRDRAHEVRMQRDAAIARRAEKQQRLDNVLELVAAGGKGASVAAQVSKLTDEIDSAEGEIKKLDAEVRGAEGSDREDPAASFLELQRQLRETDGDDHIRTRAAVAQRLRGLVDRIVVGHEEAAVLMSDGGEGYVSGF